MKILILRFSSIGDIVLTTPVVRCLRHTYPDAEIHYATKQAFASIVQSNPYINKVYTLGSSVLDLVGELRKEHYDYIVDLHHNQRTLLIKTLLGKKSAAFDKLNYEKWLLVNFKIDKLPNVHIVDRYLDTCKELGVSNDGKGLDYFIGKDDVVDVATLPVTFQQGYVAWVIGAKQNTKKFPVEKIIATLSRADFPNAPVMLLGGKEDMHEAEAIYNACKDKVELYNAAGKYKLNQSASLVQQAKAVIANDTGLMHIAAAYKRPVVSIWGNTVPKFGMYPYYGALNIPNVTLQVERLSCRPCSKLGYSACPKGHFKCMKDIQEAGVVVALQQILQ